MQTDRALVDIPRETLNYQAKDLGWKVYKWEPQQCKVRLIRGTTRIDLWLSKKSTVAVMQKGKKAVYHRYVVETQLQELLSNS